MFRLRCLMTTALLGLPVAAVAIDPTAAKPPVAKIDTHKTKLHGEDRADDYFWLRDKTNPEVVKHLEAENAYTAAVMKPTEALQEALYKEYLGRIKQTDLSVPYKDRGFWYYTRTEEGKQYPIHCRKEGTLDATEELLLDVNELARGEKFFSLGGLEVSDDGGRVAFLTDTTGFREYFVSVKDLRSGNMLETRFVKASQIEWAADNATLYYTTEDAAKRSHKVWRHTIGKPVADDANVAEEKDELFRMGVSRSRDGKYLFLSSRSATTSEMWFRSASDPKAEWRSLAPRVTGHDYTADHRDGQFYIRTNKDKATNFKAMTCPVDKTDPAGWKEFVPYNPAVMVTGLSVFKNFAVISEREVGIPQLRFIDFRDKSDHRVVFPEAVYSAGLGRNPDFDATSVQLSYTSMVTPATVYEYDPTTKVRKVLKKTEVLGGYNPDDYATEWVFATSADGTKVPISMVYKKGLKRDGTAPCLLYGYGSYGSIMPVGFSSARLAMLDRGVVFAQGHVRGGSDMGRLWYDTGKLLSKKNTFTDFIACADFLVKEKYCDRGKLVLQGGSAGGLLVGATVNMRPDVCKAAVLQVPFVDVVTTMLDETLPLTVQEFLEWGNPKNKPEYEYMKSYDPYGNLAKKDYPAILVTTSVNDSQVLFHEPTKYVAKLRTLKTDKNALLFKCNMAGGHGGSSGRYDALKEQAFVMAFVLDQMGITK